MTQAETGSPDRCWPSPFWSGRRVLVTGHTGFKGAWLCLWLSVLGARVSGFSLPPATQPNLHDILGLALDHAVIGDVRDRQLVADTIARVQPQIVFHLAAQALVRPSYAAPCDTFATNVLGTAHVLEAVRDTPTVEAVVVVTTDKVYDNAETGQAFGEDDPLGGADPYSASKACAELLTASYRRSFFAKGQPRVATARAGNVIGGGDWCSDRLVPDLVRAHARGKPVILRHPTSIRPWQHVLEPLAGYLMMAEAMVGRQQWDCHSLNFAPHAAGARSVADLVDAFAACMPGHPGWVLEAATNPHEAGILKLSAERAAAVLGWQPRLDFDETVDWTAMWYRTYLSGASMHDPTREQIAAYAKRLVSGRSSSNAQAAEGARA